MDEMGQYINHFKAYKSKPKVQPFKQKISRTTPVSPNKLSTITSQRELIPAPKDEKNGPRLSVEETKKRTSDPTFRQLNSTSPNRPDNKKKAAISKLLFKQKEAIQNQILIAKMEN